MKKAYTFYASVVADADPVVRIFCDSFTFKKRTKNVQKRWTRKVEYTLKCNSFTLKFFLHYSYENGLYLCRLDGYLKWKVCILIFEP